MSTSSSVNRRIAAILFLIAVLGVVGLIISGSSARAQSSSLTVTIATWKSADGIVEMCVDLRDAAVGETRQCPDRRQLTVARAPDGRWLRSRPVHIAPEVALWIRARRVGERLDLGLGVWIEGRARGLRSSSWSLDWPTTPIDQWQRTRPILLQLPVAPHPELWDSPAGIAEGASRLQVGQPAPEFRLPRLAGPNDSLISLSSARSSTDRLTLIVFWASWAPLVGETLSVLGDLAASESDIAVIGVNVYEVTEGAGKQFAQDYGTGLLQLVDNDGTVAQHYRVDGVPELFVLDSEGVYQGVIRGAAPLTEILSAIYGVESSP
jgi:peroxiredoxin